MARIVSYSPKCQHTRIDLLTLTCLNPKCEASLTPRWVRIKITLLYGGKIDGSYLREDRKKKRVDEVPKGD